MKICELTVGKMTGLRTKHLRGNKIARYNIAVRTLTFLNSLFYTKTILTSTFNPKSLPNEFHLVEMLGLNFFLSNPYLHKLISIPEFLNFPFSGVASSLPRLPTIPGDEGVGNAVEIGKLVTRIKVGDRVIFNKPQLGTWRYYGIYNESDLFSISPNIPLAEASMLAAAPSAAYRMIKDFFPIQHGQTVIQNAANSPVGQSVIQICRSLGINTFNIVATHCEFETVKAHLEKIGATTVFTLEEAEAIVRFETSLKRPILGINCLGCRFENVLLRLLEKNGAIVYYGCAYNSNLMKRCMRPDLTFHKFDITEWFKTAPCIEKTKMITEISKLITLGKFKAPMYMPLELKNYVTALRNTAHCEAFSTLNYVFDFSLP